MELNTLVWFSFSVLVSLTNFQFLALLVCIVVVCYVTTTMFAIKEANSYILLNTNGPYTLPSCNVNDENMFFFYMVNWFSMTGKTLLPHHHKVF